MVAECVLGEVCLGVQKPEAEAVVHPKAWRRRGSWICDRFRTNSMHRWLYKGALGLDDRAEQKWAVGDHDTFGGEAWLQVSGLP